MPLEENSNEYTDDQLDALADGLGDDSYHEIPMTENELPPEQQAPKEDPFKDFAFKANGKEIIPKSVDDIKKWAGMGYNYAQHMGEFNKQKAVLEEKYGLYNQIDEFAKKNPDWWEHVNQSFQQKQNPSLLNDQNAQQKNELDNQDQNNDNDIEAKIESFLQQKYGDKFQAVESFLNDQRTQQERAEDEALAKEVQSIREQNSDLDWDGFDENGKSLELRIYEHAKENGINSFRAAFRDFYHEHLTSAAERRAEEKFREKIQKQTKLGLLGETPAPLKKLQTNTDPRNKSYDDLEREALEELGIN